jgi:Na+-transporting NADH:ubiquinone oxidoreductase subunit NqrE
MTARQSWGRAEVWSAKSPSVAIGVTVQVEEAIVVVGWWVDVRRSQLVFASMLGGNATVELADVVAATRVMYKDLVSAIVACLVQLLIQKYVIALESPLSVLIRQ